jgi:proteasome lid subunit RPN8/RPN11
VEKSLPRNETILGFFHSHPDCPAQASATDREFARFWPGFVWLIYRVDGGRVVDRRGWLLGPTDEWLPLATATG